VRVSQVSVAGGVRGASVAGGVRGACVAGGVRGACHGRFGSSPEPACCKQQGVRVLLCTALAWDAHSSVAWAPLPPTHTSNAGVDDVGLAAKQQVVAAALHTNAELIRSGPLGALQACGGLEIAAMVGSRPFGGRSRTGLLATRVRLSCCWLPQHPLMGIASCHRVLSTRTHTRTHIYTPTHAHTHAHTHRWAHTLRLEGRACQQWWTASSRVRPPGLISVEPACGTKGPG